jgi:glycosyltransferase involved in cell wall biosynthesis
MEAALARMGLEPGGYALFVGALEPKKNIRRLIEAYLDVDAPYPLVIVGRKAWLWEEDFAALSQSLGPAAKQRLRFMGYAPREDLRALYAGAMMFLFPSLYEGFGLPALEAMRMGCPTIVSRVASLPEVCGEAALYVDPMDRADIRARIEQLMSDAALRTRLATAGPAQAERFSFDAYVQRLGEAYGRLGL